MLECMYTNYFLLKNHINREKQFLVIRKYRFPKKKNTHIFFPYWCFCFFYFCALSTYLGLWRTDSPMDCIGLLIFSCNCLLISTVFIVSDAEKKETKGQWVKKLCLSAKEGLAVGQWEDNCFYVIQSWIKMIQWKGWLTYMIAIC